MRIVFMGTPDFAAQALKNILDAKFNVVAVYTQPPKPVGRGYTVQKSATHILADANGIPVFYPKTLRTAEAQTELAALKPDMCVVAAYGFILPQAVLDIPTFGCVNIHASLLPRWRGAAPIQHAILAGDTETGITLMKMDAGMDTGDMLFKRAIKITSTCTSGALFGNLAQLGAEMIVEYLNNPSAHSAIVQDETLSTLAPKITKQMGQLNWHHSATILEQHIRAFTPWPGSFAMYNDTPLKIGSAIVQDNAQHHAPVGTILTPDLNIACGNNSVLTLLTLQRPGGKMLKSAEFTKGFPIPVGTRFSFVE